MAKTPGSKRAKGARAERAVAEAYRRYDIDPKATRMPMSGAMAWHKGDVNKPNDYKYIDEVKNQEKILFWKWWEQAQSQASMSQVPVLHITSNNRPIITCMDLEDYMDLRKQVNDLQAIIDEYRRENS